MNTTNLSAYEALNSAIAGVLSRMSAGIFATMALAGMLSASGLVPMLFSGFFKYLIIFAPLAISLFLAWRQDKMSESEIKAWFFGFAASMGASLGLLFSVYTSLSIAGALVGTTGAFVALAGYGYFTKRDLSKIGPFLFAGVIGLIIASIVNIFMESTALQMTLNVLCIVIFLGLTAYDMNRIRDSFWNMNEKEIQRQQWLGALSLYINFINIFTSILQLTGEKE